MVQTPEGERPCLDVLQHASQYRQTADDPENAEYFVKVDWLDAVPAKKAINEAGLFGKPTVLIMLPVHQLSHGGLGETEQIPGGEPGVFSSELDLARKRQIIADEDLGTGHNPCRERLVVAIADANDPAVVLLGFATYLSTYRHG